MTLHLTTMPMARALPQLRDYQEEVVQGVRDAILAGHRKILVAVPTGGGKTTIAGHMIHGSLGNGRRSLFLAHRKELVEQCYDRLTCEQRGFGLKYDTGLIMAGCPPRRRKPVQVASLQTLIRRELPQSHLVFVDEAHHSLSASFLQLLEQYQAAGAIIIGLTATPYRLDGRGLGDVYDVIVAPVSVGDLIGRGYLTPVRYYGTRKDLEPVTEDVKVRAGEFDAAQLYAKFDKRELYDGVVQNYLRFAEASKAIVFNVNVEHSLKVVAAFRAAGIGAEHVDGETPRGERERILHDFRNGAFEVLCNVNILTEGFDLPAIETVILNRATKSKSLYLQMVGRGLRPSPGKSHCVVIDQGGNVRQFGPVEAPQEYVLEYTAPKGSKGSGAGQGAPPMKECPACEQLLLVQVRECGGCGHQFEASHQQLKQEDFLELTDFLPATVKAKPVTPAHLRKRFTDMTEAELREFQELKGYKPGWVYAQLQRRTEGKQAA